MHLKNDTKGSAVASKGQEELTNLWVLKITFQFLNPFECLENTVFSNTLTQKEACVDDFVSPKSVRKYKSRCFFVSRGLCLLNFDPF